MRTRLLLLGLLVAVPLRAAVTGRVFDVEGNPAAGVRVRAFAREASEAFFARALSASPEPKALATVMTADDGSFSIDPKGAILVDLFADVPGKSAAATAGLDGEDNGALILRPMPNRRGRVMAGGKPVAGALVVTRLAATRTDASGYYESEGLSDTPWIIHPDFAIERGSPPRARQTSVTMLTPGVAIRGRVVGADGKSGVANASVAVNGWQLARSAEDGSFTIAHALPKWRVITAIGDGSVAVSSRRDAASYTLQLRPAASIDGTVKSGKAGVPVAGAFVLVRPEGDSSTARSTVADAKGRFTIADLTPGAYNLDASHPSFAQRPVSVRVREGERLHRDLVGSPVSRLTGTVLDEERKPVAGAAVGATFGVPTITTADGKFALRMPPNPQGTYVTARKKGYAIGIAGPFTFEQGETKRATVVLPRGFELRLRAVDRDDHGLPGEPVRIQIPDDDEMFTRRIFVCDESVWPCLTGEDGAVSLRMTDGTYDFVVGGAVAAQKELPAQPITAKTSPMTVVLERGVEVSGRVTYPDGTAISQSVSVVIATDGPQFGRMPRPTQTDADGTFVMTALAPGRVTLFARSNTPASAEGPPVEVKAPSSNVVLNLPKPVSVEGRVVERGTTQPVRDFSIAARRYATSRGYSVTNHSFASEEGRFLLDDLPDGKFDLVVTSAGYAPALVSSTTAKDGQAEPLTIQLDRGAKVVVHVTSSGSPVAEAQVNISTMARDALPPPRFTVTDSDGMLTFDSLAAGDYTVSVTKEGFAVARQTAEATVGKESTVEVELTRGRELRGRVVDAGGVPVGAARVMVRSGPSAGRMTRNRVETDGNGSFTLDGMVDGEHTIAAEKNGYISGVAEGVDPSRTPNVTITLQRGGTITGHVSGVSDGEMLMVRVSAFAASSHPTARPDASGHFVLEGVPDGRVMVRAAIQGTAGPSRQTPTETVEVVSGSAPPVELEFGRGIAVRGRVTKDGAAVPMASVTFSTRGGGLGAGAGMAQTRGDGTYELTVAGRGVYGVSVRSGAIWFDAGLVTVSEAMTHDIAIGGSTLRGRVIDEASGAPVAGAAVDATRVNPRGRGGSAATDSEGRFSIDALAAGSYEIRAMKQRYGPTVQNVEVGEGRAPDVELRLRGGERMVVRVVDATDQRPLDGAISLMDAANKPMYGGPLTRDAEGNTVLWLLPGHYTARVIVPQYAVETVGLDVPGPEKIIGMRRSGRIMVQGTREGGTRARLVQSGAQKTIRTVPLPPGIFENVTPGAYTVELLDSKGKVLDGRPAVVGSGQTVTVRFE